MTNSAVNKIFEKFRELRVLVIGDAMIDTYIWGKTERLSPEAPVPIISVNKRENRLGGAANVCRNIQALGATPILFSLVGNDENGKVLENLLQKRNISTKGIFTERNRKTTVKKRIISSGKQILRIDEETTEYISEEIEKQIIDAIKEEIRTQKTDVIIFVDYDKGIITPKLFERIHFLAQKHGIPTTVDPKKRNFNNYKNVDLFKPNFKEFIEGTNLQIDKGNLVGLKTAAETFMQKQQHKHLLITLSELGSFICSKNEARHFPVAVRDIVDVSGAGDTVISVASLAMAVGLSPTTIAQMSNLAGGLVCSKLGVTPIDKQQLIDEMQRQNIY